MPKTTLPLTVANTGFLLDRLGEDCHPLQYVRELTQNAIEAIRRVGREDGKILWDVDWTMHDLEGGPFKLCIVDNGDGMTGHEMMQYINQLSSSGSAQRLDGNYGVGAKIAAATRNRHGLLYLSWKNGSGTSVHLWRDPESGQYGLRQFERPDGSFGHFVELEDTVKPDAIKGHGTKITLLGNAAEQDTVAAPESCTARDRWILKYLNTRYFRIPDGITITARESVHGGKARERGFLRNVYGQASFLADGSIKHGSLQLKSARVRWWIVKERKDLVTEGPSYETAGHLAALYQDAYDLTTGRTGRALLQQFGIVFGADRVVIYVEPTTGSVTTNTARTRLIVNRQDLRWSDWASEFRQKMPAELRAFMEDVGAKALNTDHTRTIRERLKPLLDLYRVSRYRMVENGQHEADASNLTRGASVNPTAAGSAKGRKTAKPVPAAGSVYGAFIKQNGTPADRVHPDVFPKVVWVSAEDGTRTTGDIEDRAARYLAGENKLLINRDFRVFQDMVDRWAAEFDGAPGSRVVCERVIRGWFEQTLVEAVLGVQHLKDSPEWDCRDIEAALSEGALTAAIMPRYFINYAAKRDISTKLGKLT